MVHVELFFDPQSHTERGVPLLAALGGIRDALAAGRAKLGISSHVIMCFLRHLGPAAAMATLLEVSHAPFAQCPWQYFHLGGVLGVVLKFIALKHGKSCG